MVQMLLGRGASHQPRDENGDSPLHLVCLNGHQATAALLLENGFSMDSWNSSGATLLLAACRDGNPGLVKKLIDRGAEPDAAGAQGDTPLLCVLRYEFIETARVLISAGVSLDAVNLNQETGHFDVVQLLLESEARADGQAVSGNTILICIARWDHLDTVTALIGGGWLPSSKKASESQLFPATLRTLDRAGPVGKPSAVQDFRIEIDHLLQRAGIDSSRSEWKETWERGQNELMEVLEKEVNDIERLQSDLQEHVDQVEIVSLL